jgi:hypothetical protein
MTTDKLCDRSRPGAKPARRRAVAPLRISGALAAAALLLALTSCAADQRRFPVRAPMLVDPDSAPFSPRPAKFVSPEIWDTVDNLAFEPLVHALSLSGIRRAINVNALDEVPDSSWFTNRVDQLAAAASASGDLAPWTRGACAQPPPDFAGPWTVIGGKPNGANPGFLVEHVSGRRFLFKLDGGREGERPGAADVIGSRLYYVAGYYAPCNRIAFLDPATIRLSPTATAEDFVGDKIPFTQQMLIAALARGMRGPGNTVRGGLSELLEGKPLGPWTDFGTRPDDPNDVVPHEHRRELRGSYVLAALLSHYDAREQNSLDVWISQGDSGAGFVRHYMLDFGDCFGSQSASDRVSRRRSHAYELEWTLAFTELVTLGLLPRPWRNPSYGPGGATLGYYAAEPFDPERFRTAYPYGPLSRVTEADAAWGARILARIPVAALTATVAEAQLSSAVVRDALVRALLGRREQLLRRFLGKLSPLALPRLDGGRLCVSDSWVHAGLGSRAARPLRAQLDGAALAISDGAGAAESCAALPATPAPYQIVTLSSGPEHPLRVHLAAADGGYLVVGLERP